MIFKSKANKALDKHEDPRETLDYSYERQRELLQKVRRSGRCGHQPQARRTAGNSSLAGMDKLTLEPPSALAQGREDLAREALTRKSGLQGQPADLQTQHASLAAEEEKLACGPPPGRRLGVEAFRTRKETIKAQYRAAEAQTRVNDAFSGLSEEMGDVGQAIQRAEDKTQQMQARAGAVDELIASGALEDPTGMVQDDITRELDAMASGSGVESELEAMKSQLGIAGPGTTGAQQVQPGFTSPAIEADQQKGQQQ